jgi:hypothetical protein
MEGGEHLPRFSFLGAEPWMVVRGRGAEMREDEKEVAERDSDSLVRNFLKL